MRIGILGGTFNPIHVGHLVLAEEAREKLNLDKVIFVPAYIPPHKKEEALAEPNDRFKMVELALRGNSDFEVSSFEIDSKTTSYSVETLKAFKQKYGEEAKLFFITGADSLGEIYSWKEIDQIFKLSHFIVANRPGYDIANGPADNKIKFCFDLLDRTFPGSDIGEFQGAGNFFHNADFFPDGIY